MNGVASPIHAKGPAKTAERRSVFERFDLTNWRYSTAERGHKRGPCSIELCRELSSKISCRVSMMDLRDRRILIFRSNFNFARSLNSFSKVRIKSQALILYCRQENYYASIYNIEGFYENRMTDASDDDLLRMRLEISRSLGLIGDTCLPPPPRIP